MNGSATVTGNTAKTGGGILVQDRLEVNDTAWG
jgi:predicted outer membrane repeat protein